MDVLEWKRSYDTGIEEIDNQHRQLLNFLNELGEGIASGDAAKTREIIEGLNEYTISHFAFEEALMEEAQYPYSGPHKHVHKTLIQRVTTFSEKLSAGENISEELYAFLRRWLINHIQRDDKAYVSAVDSHFKLQQDAPKEEKAKSLGWITRMTRKFFG